MPHPLDGPRLKVIRAREHLQSLAIQQLRFFEDNPFPITEEIDRQTGQHFFRVGIDRHPPTHRFAALVGDCSHNLRSALDHLVWRLSDDFGGTNPDDTATQFPIFRTEIGYNTRGSNQIARVGPSAAAVIRLLQPFHDQEPRVHPLWFVRELDNGDKHRELAVTANGYAHRLHHPKDARGTFNLLISVEDLKDGEIFAELTISPAEPEVRVEAHFGFEIALTQPTVPITQSRLFAVTFLDYLADRVSAVIDRFQPFYATGKYDDSVVLSDPLEPFHKTPPTKTPKTPPTLTDEAHAAWAARAKERIDAGALGAWDMRLAGQVDSDAEIEPLIRSALRLSGAQGFLAGSEMAMERVEQYRAEVGELGDGELTVDAVSGHEQDSASPP